MECKCEKGSIRGQDFRVFQDRAEPEGPFIPSMLFLVSSVFSSNDSFSLVLLCLQWLLKFLLTGLSFSLLFFQLLLKSLFLHCCILWSELLFAALSSRTFHLQCLWPMALQAETSSRCYPCTCSASDLLILHIFMEGQGEAERGKVWELNRSWEAPGAYYHSERSAVY